jgi:hypothetical protein
MSRAAEWLSARSAAAPAALVDASLDAVREVEAEDVPGALGEAGVRRLERVLASPADRSAALDLLVADGLLTYACEAAAAEPAAALDVLCAQLADRLAALLPPDASTGDA